MRALKSNLFFLLLLILLLLIVHAASAESLDVARCSQAPVVGSSLASAFVSTSAAAFRLPNGMTRTVIDSPDSNEVEWTGDETRVRYSYSSAGPGVQDSEAGARPCKILIDGSWFKVLLEGSFFRIADDEHRTGVHTVNVEANDERVRAQVLREALACFRYINRWSRIKITDIDDGLAYFRYSNEICERKKAVVGDVITRDWGRVQSIGKSGVVVIELRSDETGGFEEVTRILRRSGKSRCSIH